MMVGNSLRSDIWPALNAGAFAVHIPSEFEWARERAETPENEPRFQRLCVVRRAAGLARGSLSSRRPWEPRASRALLPSSCRPKRARRARSQEAL